MRVKVGGEDCITEKQIDWTTMLYLNDKALFHTQGIGA